MNQYSVTIHNLQMVHVWVHLAYCHVLMCILKEAEKSDKIVRSNHPSVPLQGTGQLSPDAFSWNFTFGIIHKLKQDKITHTLHEKLHMVMISCQ